MVLRAIDYVSAKDATPASLKILDQLRLPHETIYIDIKNCEDGFDAIKRMKVRGAPAIAIVAALALSAELSQTGYSAASAHEASEHIVSRLQYLKKSRPTAVNLSDAVKKLSEIVTGTASVDDATAAATIKAYTAAAERMLIDDVADNMAIGEHGARWILQNTEAGQCKTSDRSKGLKILTICNTGSLATAGYGTALGVIRSLWHAGSLDRAFACETRPYNQGSRLTAYELLHDQIPTTLITDSMAASLLAKEGSEVAAIVVGADRVAANGDTANKIGTYALAVLAKHHNVKFLVAAPRTTIDIATASGAEIVIEERPAEELTYIRGPSMGSNGKLGETVTISTAAPGVEVWNPAFDVTPAALIDGVVTERGVIEKQHDKFDFKPLFDTLKSNGTQIKSPSIGGL